MRSYSMVVIQSEPFAPERLMRAMVLAGPARRGSRWRSGSDPIPGDPVSSG